VRYRWAVLTAGTFAQTSFSALAIGLPVLVPTLREEYDLTLGQVGVVLGAEWVGALVTMLPWGIAADRFGERVVLVLGLSACAILLAVAAHAPDFESLVVLLALAGGAGASVNSASGRAVMHWFAASERGLALGVRQTAVPLGGLIAALVVPQLTSPGDATNGILFFAVFCAVGCSGRRGPHPRAG
jgi:sugar phosphate permease